MLHFSSDVAFIAFKLIKIIALFYIYFSSCMSTVNPFFYLFVETIISFLYVSISGNIPFPVNFKNKLLLPIEVNQERN